MKKPMLTGLILKKYFNLCMAHKHVIYHKLQINKLCTYLCLIAAMGGCASSAATSAASLKLPSEKRFRRAIKLYEVGEVGSLANFFNRNRCFKSGESPLTLAAEEGHEAIVQVCSPERVRSQRRRATRPSCRYVVRGEPTQPRRGTQSSCRYVVRGELAHTRGRGGAHGHNAGM